MVWLIVVLVVCILAIPMLAQTNATADWTDALEYAVEFDDVDYWGGIQSSLDTFAVTPGLEILAFGWRDLEIETYNKL